MKKQKAAWEGSTLVERMWTMTDLTDKSQKQKRLEMIRKAMTEKAPQTYSELEKSGNLEQFLEAHDAEMMKSFNNAKNKAWEETMATFLDFTDPFYDETSSPM
jgi:acetoin utilization deacetylase AcuC-like enzyme